MDEALELVVRDPEGALQLVAALDDATLTREIEERLGADPTGWPLRFQAGSLYFHRGQLASAIEHFQMTVQVREFELRSYDYLGQAFVKDKRFGLEMAVRQFRKGLSAKGHPAEAYLGLRYNLAMLLYLHGRLHEALTELKQIAAVDVAFRDAYEWQKQIEQEIASPRPPRPPAVAVGMPLPPRPITRALGKRWPKGRP